MKKNKIAFLIAEILLCVMAIFFITKIFDQNIPEKKVAVIIPNSGDKNWASPSRNCVIPHPSHIRISLRRKLKRRSAG